MDATRVSKWCGGCAVNRSSRRTEMFLREIGTSLFLLPLGRFFEVYSVTFFTQPDHKNVILVSRTHAEFVIFLWKTFFG